MVYRFNPPPGWPAPPQGWSPPPDWQPDPSWPPAPPGWQFWVDDGGANPGAAAAADAASAGAQDQGAPGVHGAPGAPEAAGATVTYQYAPSAPLDQPSESPYDTAILGSGHETAILGTGAGGQAAGFQQPGHPGGQGYAGAHGDFPGAYAGHSGVQSGDPGAPGGVPGQGGGHPEEKNSNTGVIIGVLIAAVVLVGALIWGGIAAFGGNDPEPTATAPAPTDDPADDPGDGPVEDPGDDPADEPVDDPADDQADDPADDPADDQADDPADDPADGPADADGQILSLGDEVVVGSTASSAEITLAVVGVEPWPGDNLICTEPDLDEYIAVQVEVTAHRDVTDIQLLNFGVADANQTPISEVNAFGGLFCDNPNMLPTEMSADQTYTGTLILDVPDEAAYILWEDWLDFSGDGPTYLWQY